MQEQILRQLRRALAIAQQTVDTASAVVPGGRRTLAAVAILFLFTFGLLVVPAGRALLRDQLLGRGPDAIRDLPGVRAVIGLPVPTFRDAVLDVPAPLAVDVTRDGSVLYVVEGGETRVVRRIPLQGDGAPGELVPPGTTPGNRKPISVAVSPTGFVYVVDRVRVVVDVFSPDGVWIQVLEPAAPALWEPLAVEIGPDGQIFVLNAAVSGPPVAIYTAERVLDTVVDRIAVGDVRIWFPSGIGVTEEGFLLISDSNNGRMVMYDPQTGEAAAYANVAGQEQFSLPRGLAFDSAGRVFVADPNAHSIGVFDPSGAPPQITAWFGGQGIADGEMLFPNDVAVDDQDFIYVADRDNDRVQIWR